jgi:hypothetical protein
MTIQKYEDWMRPQVVELFDLEYGTDKGSFDTLFQNFYEHSFQQKQCIRIVSLDGEIVSGFQSFFYWPVSIEGNQVLSYQSGNSLVHPQYRGKGIFAKLLNYIHQPESGLPHDLLIGFPVEASYNSFIRNKWLNPFNLQWYVKVMSPVTSLFSNPELQLKKKWGERKKESLASSNKVISVEQTASYDDYRFAYESGDYYRYTFEQNGEKVMFELKAQRRKKYIKELIIGKMIASKLDQALINSALKSLIKEVKCSANFTMLSFAINPLSTHLTASVDCNGFKKIDKQIYFISKGPIAEKTTDWSNWWMFRGDIDTW